MNEFSCRLRHLWASALLLAWAGGAAADLAVGSVAMYSDGRVEKLLSHENGQLLWEDDRKRRFLRSEIPVVPVLERREFLSGRGYTQAIQKGDPESIRARPIGERVEFTMNRIRHTGENSSRIWECVYHGEIRKKVLGVVRVLDSYTCERFIYHRKTWQRMFRESRKFLYSRELGVVVDLKRKTRKKQRSRKLVAIIPPEKAGYKQLSRKVRKLRARK